jgi:hypothetical protein
MNNLSRMLLRPSALTELNCALNVFLAPPLRIERATLDTIVLGFEAWGQALGAELGQDVGLPFLKTWWRAPQLQGVLRHEFGEGNGLGPLDFRDVIDERLWAPVGTVLHWPAANVPIQPFLSATSGILAGNRNIVRVPTALTGFVEAALAAAPVAANPILERLLFIAFAHDRHDLASACAARSDAAMIWGGQEAVASVRGLPFPHWARLQVFGPRISAVMVLLDEQTLDQLAELQRLCRRIARETWQFDQQACSSPLALYLQVTHGAAAACDGRENVERAFVEALAQAFGEEERAHPRNELDARTSVDIALARSSWLLGDEAGKALIPSGPAWSILYGGEMNRDPEPDHGKILHVVSSDDLETTALRLDSSTQTVGIWIHDTSLEASVARLALSRGVDRVVRLGLMHVFNTPWDGHELVRPLCRKVHFIPTRPTERSADARG